MSNLSDWEAMLKDVSTGRYQKYSDEMAHFIVPGSQKWVVWRIVE